MNKAQRVVTWPQFFSEGDPSRTLQSEVIVIGIHKELVISQVLYLYNLISSLKSSYDVGGIITFTLMEHEVQGTTSFVQDHIGNDGN